MTEQELYAWIGLRSVPGIGNVTFRRLLERFDAPENVFLASPGELSLVRGMTPAVLNALAGGKWRSTAEQEIAALSGSGIRVVTFLDAEYPKSLFEIPDPPSHLYVKGALPVCHCIAIVGARRATTIGIRIAGMLSSGLASAGVSVISGLARGIDTAAHKGALKGGGTTVAVLGCGIDTVYPPENRGLYEDIAASGALISEYPLGTKPMAEHFPRRNRIISGMAHGVLVVEAAAGSGSLITAEYALEQGREVYAVPGNITCPTCCGTNGLIKQGAKLVDCIEDILEDLPGCLPGGGATPPAPTVPFALTPREAAVYEIISREPLHIDDIMIRSELTVSELSSILLNLELKGAVEQLPGKHYSKS